MKIIRFDWQQGTMYGVVHGDVVHSLEGSIFTDFRIGKELCNLSEVKVLPPVLPQIVVGVGLNYRETVEELGLEMPSEPLLFFKPPSSVIGHLVDIIHPKISEEVWEEGELAVVIKCTARNVSEDKALDYVLGYTCGNDVTAIDIMRKDKLVGTRGKSFDTFCPIGPCIATDLDPSDLRIKSRVNGALKLDSSTKGMIFNTNKVISYITQFMTLEPGDIILTGTPGGGANKVSVGDTIEVEIEGIGILRNGVVSE